MAGRWFPPAKNLSLINAVTSASGAAAFLSLLLAVRGADRWSLTLIAAAVVCDRLDGILARRLHRKSAFGGELDSLADALAFCVAPAFLGFMLGLRTPLETVLLAVFVLSGLWRLAHYNTTGLGGDSQNPVYSGVPTVVTAAWFVALAPVWLQLPAADRGAFLLALYTLGAVLMVSGVRYPKEGLLTHVLYVLLPLGTVAIWLL